MRATHTDLSERRVCVVLQISRGRVRRVPSRPRRSPRLSEPLVGQLHALIERYPTYGYRRFWAMLRYGHGQRINQKAVYRVLRVKR